MCIKLNAFGHVAWSPGHRKSLLVNRKSVELYLVDADCFLLFSSACLRDTVHSSPNGHEDTELFIPSQFAV